MKSQMKVVLLLLTLLVLTACNKKVKEEAAVDPNAGNAQQTQPADQGTGISEPGAFSAADRPSARHMRVSSGSMTPSSHNRALA